MFAWGKNVRKGYLKMASNDLESIKGTVRGFFADPLLKNDYDLWYGHKLDSFSIVELLLFLEEKLQLDVFSEEINQENFSTINHISQYVYSRLQSSNLRE